MFFTNKVNNIKATTAWALAGRVYNPLPSDLHHQGPQLSAFASITEDEVTKLIGSMPTKSSPLDFVPTLLLRACRYTFAHVITRLANLSFEHATFPAKFKTVSVTPLVKKHGLDATDPASYRPISNLNTVSKILERLVLNRVIPHVLSYQASTPCSLPITDTIVLRRHFTK